jgi:hypothetical protein
MTPTTTRYTKEIDETIAEIDSQLWELDKAPIYSLPHRIALIRHNLHRLFNFRKGVDIDSFASRKPGEPNPIDWFWQRQNEEKNKQNGL